MQYGEILNAQETGEELIAQIAGCDIPVIVAAVSKRIRMEMDPKKGRYVPIGRVYSSIEVRDLCGSGVYHVSPELLRTKSEKIRESIEEIEGRANHE